MSYQPRSEIAPQPSHLPVFPVDTDRHLTAVKALTAAFEAKRPVALLIDESELEASHVMGEFVAGLAEHSTVVRLKDPHTDALAAIDDINRALGFLPKALELADQRNILMMFLEFQATHRRRTVLCIEQTDQQPLWLLDTVADLINPAASQHGGLMVVLSGKKGLDQFLKSPSLNVLRTTAGKPIRLARGEKQLRLDAVDLASVDNAALPSTQRAASERLIVRLNGVPIKEIPVNIGEFVIGRGSSADICLPSSFVSRRHATITKTDQAPLTVSDLGSKNGTFVGRRRITKCWLRPDEVMNVGDFEIQYKAH